MAPLVLEPPAARADTATGSDGQDAGQVPRGVNALGTAPSSVRPNQCPHSQRYRGRREPCGYAERLEVLRQFQNDVYEK